MTSDTRELPRSVGSQVTFRSRYKSSFPTQILPHPIRSMRSRRSMTPFNHRVLSDTPLSCELFPPSRSAPPVGSIRRPSFRVWGSNASLVSGGDTVVVERHLIVLWRSFTRSRQAGWHEMHGVTRSRGAHTRCASHSADSIMMGGCGPSKLHQVLVTRQFAFLPAPSTQDALLFPYPASLSRALPKYR